jgi:general secretion pathway protein E
MRRLGEILVEKGLIGQDELDKALAVQSARPEKLGKILSDLGFVAARDVLSALSEQLEIALVEAADFPEGSPELEGLSPRFMRQFRFVPLAVEGNRVTLAMADPLDFETIAAVRLFTKMEARALLAGESEVAAALARYYPDDAESAESAGRVTAEGEAEDVEHLRDMASEAPVIRLVNNMIARAVEQRASDIHLEPFEKDFRLRFRIDGVLYNMDPPPRELRAAVVSRLKLMAKLNIAERRLPQDGRIKQRTLGREIDLRVSTLPTLYGESVVMRLLDRSAGDFYELASLGFPPLMLARMEHYAAQPHGIFLVTGPTGSGKSTTLYAALKRINLPDKKIITIEDPVEYQMDGVNQIHVNPQIGLTFGAGLRHIVRQDPDVIMVGEIRDLETAEIAIRAALTGHLVFSTLHTNDAPSAITRLTDMGVENYLIASSLMAVLAQRLVRVICPQCKVMDQGESRADLPAFRPGQESAGPEAGNAGRRAYRGAGCQHCGGTGYRGRVGIFELMEMNDAIRRLVMQNADAGALAAAARANGMRMLKEDGWDKVEAGLTTVDELLRVTQEA